MVWLVLDAETGPQDGKQKV